MSDYDVIIVGGRPAGASLAVRLAQQKLKVLVLDRSTFPSLPAIASSPIIYEGTMKMLDEIGLKEDEYTYPGSRAENMVLNFVGYFSVVIPATRLGLERSYIRGLDRNRFDNALWQNLANHPDYITARQSFSVSDILKDESGKVIGIVGKEGKGDEERITADLVVGADGRFSMMANKVGAKMVEERNEFTTGVYQAQWENVKPFKEGFPPEACLYNTAKGYLTIFMPIGEGRYYVIAYMRSEDAQRGTQTPQEFYVSCLQRLPDAWKRLDGAKQTSEMEAMRPIENGYREAFGNGWVLVGDAFHYKDPIDGQGIYDAMIESKHLAEVIGQWKSGKLTWEQAGEQYRQKSWDSTHPMFEMTTGRVKNEVHTFPPPFIIKTLIRWLVTDPGYQRTLLRALARVDAPNTVPAMPTAGMIWRGILRSFSGNGGNA